MRLSNPGLIFIALLTLSTLPSCDKDEGEAKPTTTELLEGKWNFSSSNYMAEWSYCQNTNNWVFSSNGQLTRNYYRDDGTGDCQLSRAVTYPYHVEGNKIITTMDTKEGLDTNYTFTILEPTPKVLILQSYLGEDQNDVISDVYFRE